MARITVEDCLTKQTNRFALIHLSSKRTKQLLQGARVVLAGECDNKPVVTSLREIAEGKVVFMTPEEEQRLKDLGLEHQVPGLEPVPPAANEEAVLEQKNGSALHGQNGGAHAAGNGASSKVEEIDEDDEDLEEDEGEDEDEDTEEAKAKPSEAVAEESDNKPVAETEVGETTDPKPSDEGPENF